MHCKPRTQEATVSMRVLFFPLYSAPELTPEAAQQTEAEQQPQVMIGKLTFDATGSN